SFRLSDATPADVAAGAPALGCGLYLAGAATRGDRTVPFTACLDFPDDAVIEGAPLGHTLSGATGPALGLTLTLQDPFEPDTLFDGVDFDAAGALDLRGDTDPSTNRLRRAASSHDHWRGTVRAEE
ncbi:MAG: hypothetical protein KC613_15465, partial [Myxococcales bacterium]|nr:hypothetical protein [Myxococcales bacterium]